MPEENFHLYMSNALEHLAELFNEKIYADAGIFAPVEAVVANAGMETFLKRKLAEKNGITANVKGVFLRNFINRIMADFLGGEEALKLKKSWELWSPDILTWRIDIILLHHSDELPLFSNYWQTGGEAEEEKRFLLARELAGFFDKYLIHRFDMLEKWQTRKIPHPADNVECQIRLYQLLCQDVSSPAEYIRKFFNSSPQGPLPERIGIFGISTLQELNLDILLHLAEYCEVHFFCPSPCRDYFVELKNKREAIREFKDDPDALGDYLDNEHLLLANLGDCGKHFLNLLLEKGCFTGDEDFFCPSGPDTLLSHFQNSILNMEKESFTPDPKDESITINSCPTQRRELEVLHDQLLNCFLSCPTLRYSDVIVMFPDINAAAPMIESVFSAGPFANGYSICDRSTDNRSSIIGCFSELLGFGRCRFTSLDILDLLAQPALSDKLGITADDIPLLTQLISRIRVIWGVDEKCHEKFRSCGFEEFSWLDGCERILTEFARGEVISEIIPSPEKAVRGGADSDTALKFSVVFLFVRELKKWCKELETPRTIPEWKAFFFEKIDLFFSSSRQYRDEINELKRNIGLMAYNAAAADFEEKVPLAVIKYLTKNLFSSAAGHHEFLRDKITFCSLVPLRAIPARIVAVMGLNEGFPPQNRHSSFDIMSQSPRRGDPNRSSEGNYLFLEALMAAREKLILSYIGKDISKNTPMFPAIPLKETIDWLDKNYCRKESEKFTQAYPLRSEDFINSDLLNGRRIDPPEDMIKNECPPAPLALPKSITVKEIGEILCYQCGKFLSLRCNYKESDNSSKHLSLQTDDSENPDYLETSNIKRAIMSLKAGGTNESEWTEILRNARMLPVVYGPLYDQIKEEIENIPEEFISSDTESCILTLEVEIDGHAIAIEDQIQIKEDDNEIFYSEIHFSTDRSYKRLKFYLNMLLICACQKKEVKGQICFSPEKSSDQSIMGLTLSDPDAAAEQLKIYLREALRIYTADHPLPLFRTSSFDAAVKVVKIISGQRKKLQAAEEKLQKAKDKNQKARDKADEAIRNLEEAEKKLADAIREGKKTERLKTTAENRKNDSDKRQSDAAETQRVQEEQQKNVDEEKKKLETLLNNIPEEVRESAREQKSKFNSPGDVTYAPEISRFYDETTFSEGEFGELAWKIFSPLCLCFKENKTP